LLADALEAPMSRPPAVARRRVLLGTAGLLGALVLGACGDDGGGGGGGGAAGASADTPRALTAEEADQLATVRLRMLRASPVAVRMEWPGSPTSVFEAHLDLADHVGWGTFTTSSGSGEGAPASSEGAVAWDFATVATAAASSSSGSGSVPPVGAWTLRSLSAEVPRDLFLVLSLSLGADRPENAQLLRQGSARFLRRDEVGGRAVSVLEGPQPAGPDDAAPTEGSRTRFWIADDGTLLRFEADLGLGADALARIDVLPSAPDDPALETTARQVLAARA
jgi:hypothetical protein